MPTRRIEIITETEREIVFTSRTTLVMHCPQCNNPTSMIMPEVAAARLGVSVRTVFRWVEAGTIHFVETEDGGLLVCERSL